MDSWKASGGTLGGEGDGVGGVRGRREMILRWRGEERGRKSDRVCVGGTEGGRWGLMGGSWRERMGEVHKLLNNG